jgi:hypothetical protein
MKKILTFETAKISRMFRRMKYFTGILLFFILLVTNIQSQTLDEAKKLYTEGKFTAALPALKAACNSAPKNASYNQWYGNSLLETGKIEEALPYLTFAASKDIIEAFNSLGKLYYLLYEFDKSAAAYEQYVQLLINNKQQSLAALTQPLVDRSKRASRMLSHCENIQIIDSVIVDKKDFLKSYLISQEAGCLEYTDKGVIYENPLKDKRYFSGKNKNGKYRLFNAIKLQDKWMDEKELAIPSDSLENDNYPFVLLDGSTIYYASTGSGSIGGYDLFITRYNSNTNTYLTPAQMGMPFNSIYNDYLVAIDENNNIGYFATDRFQEEDKVIVYTFIPNEEIQSVDLKDSKELINRAKITSIRDTWKKEVNYPAYIAEVRKNIAEEQNKIKKDFFFVINDNTIYYTLDDFKDETAKHAFAKAQELENQIKIQEKDLEDLRVAYFKGDSKYKQSVQATILYREKYIPELQEYYNKIVTNVRNLEAKYLKMKN